MASFEIVADGDLTIHLTKSEDSELPSDDIATSASIKVNRSVLVENSKYFSRLLSGGFKEEKQSTVTLYDDRVRAMLIWFKRFHDVDLTDTYDISHHEIWYLIAAADKYNFEVKHLKGWFTEWHRRTAVDQIDSRKLLYPCWIFDHALGFQRVTIDLVYNSPKGIYEVNPTKLHMLHVRPLITREF